MSYYPTICFLTICFCESCSSVFHMLLCLLVFCSRIENKITLLFNNEWFEGAMDFDIFDSFKNTSFHLLLLRVCGFTFALFLFLRNKRLLLPLKCLHFNDWSVQFCGLRWMNWIFFLPQLCVYNCFFFHFLFSSQIVGPVKLFSVLLKLNPPAHI